VVQGLGAALLEKCEYDPRGQLLNGTMADYLPDIEVGHLVSPTADSELGAKGAGTAGATGAVANAVNDALRALGARDIAEVPITPESVLRAVGRRDGLSPAIDPARRGPPTT
jgi:aerobic carbon-monoxide dehydrogenase large subunit